MKWSELRDEYASYKWRHTSNDIDVEVTTSTDCPNQCGRKLQYAGYMTDRDSYIAVAFCTECDYAEEF